MVCDNECRNNKSTRVLSLLLFIILGCLLCPVQSSICSNDSRTGLSPCIGSCSVLSVCTILDGIPDCSPSFVETWVESMDIATLCSRQNMGYNYSRVDSQLSESVRLYEFYSDDCGNCSKNNCSGTPDYCNSFPCDQNNPCSCLKYNMKPVMMYQDRLDYETFTVCYGSNWDQPLKRFQSMFGQQKTWEMMDESTDKDYLQYQRNAYKKYTNMKRNTELSFQLTPVVLSWREPEIGVYTTVPGFAYIIIRKTGLSQTLKCDNVQNNFQLGHDWFVTDEPISYVTYINMTMIDNGQLSVTSFQNCDIPDCIFCNEFGVAFHCFTSALQTMVVFFFIFFAVMIMLSIALIVLLIKMKTGGMNISIKTNDLGGLTNPAVYAMIICILICSCNAAPVCDYGFSMQSSMIDCTEVNQLITCSVNGKLLLNFPYPGLTLCFDVFNEGTLVRTISFKWIDSVKTIQTNLAYWTGPWTPIQTFTNGCATADNCKIGFNCESLAGWSGSTLATLNNQFPGKVSMIPGKSFCQQTCGCVNCGCTSCDQSCLWGRCAFATTAAWKVLRPVSTSSVNSFEICSIDSNKVSSCTTTVTSSSTPVSIQGGVFSSLSLSQSGSSYFGSNAFIMSEDLKTTYFGTAAATGLPVSQGIGDIQALSASAIKNPNINSFTYSYDICDMSFSGRKAIFSFLKSGFDITTQMPSLPTLINGITWMVSSSGVISGADPNPGTLTAGFSLTNANFTAISKSVCPKIEVVNTTGCYLCPLGMSIYLRGSSSCGSGNCVLSTNSDDGLKLNINSISLTLADQIYRIIATSQVKSDSVTIKCSSGSMSSSDSFDFDLYDPVPILNPNGTIIGYLPGSGTIQNAGFGDFWNGLDTGGAVGIIIALIIVAIVAAVIISGVTYMGYMHYLSSGYEHISGGEERNPISKKDAASTSRENTKYDGGEDGSGPLSDSETF